MKGARAGHAGAITTLQTTGAILQRGDRSPPPGIGLFTSNSPGIGATTYRTQALSDWSYLCPSLYATSLIAIEPLSNELYVLWG